ncbi:MAG: histidinol-phosphate transaminase [Aquificae bacterium]|nr:histidinol-phosphate transaminase [Aquificota bacterium]
MFARRIEKLKAYRTETTPARIRLSSNELPYDLPRWLKERIKKELAQIPFNRYPDPYATELREVLAELWGVKPENLLLGNGSDELILYLQTAVGELYEGVAYPIPTFPMYRVVADTLGRPVYEVPLDENLDLDEGAFERVLEDYRPALLFISYPNNPTGNLFSREKLERLRKKVPLMVSDEAYFDFCGETYLPEAVDAAQNVVVLRTLSKVGLASLRVGALIADEAFVKELLKVKMPFNVTYPSQVVAKVVLTEGLEFIRWAVERVVAERERLTAELSKMEGVEVFPSKANFFLFKTPFEADAVHRLLLEEGVLVRNVSYLPGLDGFLRVGVGKPEENDAFLEALRKVLKKLEAAS